MVDSILRRQLDEVRELLRRARELLGTEPLQPPADIAPEPDAVRQRTR